MAVAIVHAPVAEIGEGEARVRAPAARARTRSDSSPFARIFERVAAQALSEARAGVARGSGVARSEALSLSSARKFSGGPAAAGGQIARKGRAPDNPGAAGSERGKLEAGRGNRERRKAASAEREQSVPPASPATASAARAAQSGARRADEAARAAGPQSDAGSQASARTVGQRTVLVAEARRREMRQGGARGQQGGSASGGALAVSGLVAQSQRAAKTAAADSSGAGNAEAKTVQVRAGSNTQKSARVVVVDLRSSRDKEGGPDGGELRSSPSAQREAGPAVPAVLLRSETRPGAKPAAVDAASAARFREAVQAEMVRHASLLLREDGASGELRLVLKPESLGAVRIQLKIAEDRIEGRIVVDNKDVRALFEAVLPALEEGLRDQGFGSASLQVSVGHREGSAGGGGPLGEGRSLVAATAAEEMPAAEPWVDISPGDGLVDLMA